jgi:FkbM family methyltransferase
MRLPDGTRIHCLNRLEARFLYDEIFVQRLYLRHGIELNEGDHVVDVGANIGLFALLAARRIGTSGRLLAFEPLPPIFSVLRRNGGRLFPRAELFEFGLGEASGRASFVFYPRATGWSGRRGVSPATRDALRVYLERSRAGGAQRLYRGLGRLAPTIQRRLFDGATERIVGDRVEIDCGMERLSEVIRREGLARIDLLKIDVEGGEADVLRGIDAADWPRLRQIVMEVEDLDGALLRVRNELARRGFRVAVDQDPRLAGTPYHYLYARRPGDPGSGSELSHPRPRRRKFTS